MTKKVMLIYRIIIGSIIKVGVPADRQRKK